MAAATIFKIKKLPITFKIIASSARNFVSECISTASMHKKEKKSKSSESQEDSSRHHQNS
jgi:hypothetical protein